MTKEVLKLALDALEDIGDEWGFTSQRTVPKRKEAITAIKEALANEALEKMAENARELGLDYEPEQTEHGWTPERIAGMARLKEAQDKKLAQLEQEPVGEIVDAIEGAFKCSFTKMLPVGTKLYTTPPQHKPLSDEEIETYRHMIDWTAHWSYIKFARAIEAAHGIKGEA